MTFFFALKCTFMELFKILYVYHLVKVLDMIRNLKQTYYFIRLCNSALKLCQSQKYN